MRYRNLLLSTLLVSPLVATPSLANKTMENNHSSATSTKCASWLNHTVKQLHSNQQINLCEATANKTLLLVNTASHCGFSGQFSELEALYQDYKDEGLVIIGFPSNDFKQEARSEAETAKVCFHNFGVTFLMAAPIEVRGENAHPVFKHLAEQTGQPKWNFYKYLVNRDGEVVDWFNSWTSPQSDKIVSKLKANL